MCALRFCVFLWLAGCYLESIEERLLVLSGPKIASQRGRSSKKHIGLLRSIMRGKDLEDISAAATGRGSKGKDSLQLQTEHRFSDLSEESNTNNNESGRDTPTDAAAIMHAAAAAAAACGPVTLTDNNRSDLVGLTTAEDTHTRDSPQLIAADGRSPTDGISVSDQCLRDQKVTEHAAASAEQQQQQQVCQFLLAQKCLGE